MKKEPCNYPCIHKINHSLDNVNNHWNVYKAKLDFISKRYFMIRIKDEMVDEGPNAFHLFMKMKINKSVKRRWKWKTKNTFSLTFKFSMNSMIYT
jgi:hypothetical protein